jgi:uncharacterized MAPEG superfamily protein
MWVQRAHRAHMNMVETMPAFIAVVFAASQLASESELSDMGLWAAVFFFARVAYSVIYITGIPFLRTPSYLVSWFAIVAIAFPLL